MNPHKTNRKLSTFKMPPYIYELGRVLAFSGWKVWPAATDWLGESGCTEKRNPLLICVILIGFAGTQLSKDRQPHPKPW